MRKIVYIVITVIVTLMIWFFWGNKELQQKVKRQKSDNVATLSIQSNKSKTAKKGENTEQKNPEPIEPSKSEKDLSCYQRFALEPEWREIEKAFKEIYTDISYLDEDGNMYTNLPVESLKAFADAGDKDAMLFYGIEMMQTSAIGLSTLKRAELERRHRMEEAKVQRKAHEPNVEQFNNGVDYAYEAAVNGKLAVFMEVELYYRALARQMHERSWEQEKIHSILSESYAYKLLQKEILKNNELLVAMISSQGDEIGFELKRMYPDKENYADFQEGIKQDGQLKFRIIKKQWEVRRKDKGLESYPDFFKGEIKRFAKRMAKTCYSG